MRRARTYSVKSPIATHTRPATCDEIGCKTMMGGYTIYADETTTDGQARLVAMSKPDVINGRHYTRTQEGTVHVFRFPPGEQCFEHHRVPLDRPEIYSVTQTRRHVHPNADSWVNDFGDHLDHLAKQQ